MMPREFLEFVWRSKPEDLYFLIWTLHDKQSHWCRDLSAAADVVGSAEGRNVYVGAGLASRDHGPDHRCVSAEIAAIPGYWADFDLESEAHNQKTLPTTIEAALSIIPADLTPTIVIATGNGVHAWWLFKEPWIFETADEREEASSLSLRFQTLLRYRSNQQGWAFDRLADLARVLRMPGTINSKDPNNPKAVEVCSLDGRRYNASDFREYLEDLAITDIEAESQWDRAKRFADNPIRINLNARISQDTLDRWLAGDTRFKRTWFRQREDLDDQSQSGYDMALACFGAGIDLCDQQIVDLIVHHRVVHREKARTTVDYFQRTISKAANQSHPQHSAPTQNRGQDGSDDSSLMSSPNTDPKSSRRGAGIGNVPSDPAIAKAQLCDRLSTLLGIRILRLVKITGKEPLYRMELENGKIEFPNIGKLLGQQSMRMAIAAETNHYIPKIMPKMFEEIAQLILDALTEQDGGDEMQLEGSARIYVTQYLSDSGTLIQSLEGLRGQSARRPMVHKGEIAVCSTDLLLYINKSMSQNLTLPNVTGMLSVLGAKAIRVRGKFPEQGRWCLPKATFDPAEYDSQPEDYGSQNSE